MGAINDVGPGMRPLNMAAKLAKVAIDIQHSVAADDPASVEARLRELEDAVVALRISIANRMVPG